jgi:hypothetical protein
VKPRRVWQVLPVDEIGGDWKTNERNLDLESGINIHGIKDGIDPAECIFGCAARCHPIGGLSESLKFEHGL